MQRLRAIAVGHVLCDTDGQEYYCYGLHEKGWEGAVCKVIGLVGWMSSARQGAKGL